MGLVVWSRINHRCSDMKYLPLIILIPTLLFGCANLQPQDQTFILQQAVYRTVQNHPERAPQYYKACAIVDGLTEATGQAILDAAGKQIDDTDWELADKEAAKYLISRLIPPEKLEIPLSDEDRAAIKAGTQAIREALRVMGYQE